MPHARPALRFSRHTSETVPKFSVFLHVSRPLVRKRSKVGKPAPAVLKAQPVAEDVRLVRLKGSPVGLQFNAPPVRFINQNAEPDARSPMRAELLYQILLRHTCIEH